MLKKMIAKVFVRKTTQDASLSELKAHGGEGGLGSPPPSYADILRMTWPIVLANAAVPTLGLADTAIIGNTGSVADLGAIALGSLIFNFIYWGFGFLRMGTTGFVAQALGAGDSAEVRAVVARALLLAMVLSLGLLVLQIPMIDLALLAFSGGDEVETIARSYFLIRIWGAPATLSLFAMMGCLVGLGASRYLLALQLTLNGLNIAFDILFAGVLGWGASGIALGTLIAEWGSVFVGFGLVYRLLRAGKQDDFPMWPGAKVRDLPGLIRMLRANGDILIRTLLLVSSFALFTNQAAKFGDETLAANHVLLQLIGFSAHFLDGFAFAGESLIGRAIGARKRKDFDISVWRSTQLAAFTAMMLALILVLGGEEIVYGLNDHDSVRSIAMDFLPLAAIYVALSFAAFQLDGVFIGATRTRHMSYASALSFGVFVLAWWGLGSLENLGLWLAFIIYVVARAIALAIFYPSLRRSIP